MILYILMIPMATSLQMAFLKGANFTPVTILPSGFHKGTQFSHHMCILQILSPLLPDDNVIGRGG